MAIRCLNHEALCVYQSNSSEILSVDLEWRPFVDLYFVVVVVFPACLLKWRRNHTGKNKQTKKHQFSGIVAWIFSICLFRNDDLFSPFLKSAFWVLLLSFLAQLDANILSKQGYMTWKLFTINLTRIFKKSCHGDHMHQQILLINSLLQGNRDLALGLWIQCTSSCIWANDKVPVIVNFLCQFG